MAASEQLLEDVWLPEDATATATVPQVPCLPTHRTVSCTTAVPSRVLMATNRYMEDGTDMEWFA